MIRQILLSLGALSLCILFSACYQAQSEDDLRTIPTTNNPNVVPACGSGPMPKAGF